MGATNHATLKNYNCMGHNIFIEPTLILTMKINVGHINSQPTLNF